MGGGAGERGVFCFTADPSLVFESVTVTSSDITWLLKYTFLIKSETQGSAEFGGGVCVLGG